MTIKHFTPAKNVWGTGSTAGAPAVFAGCRFLVLGLLCGLGFQAWFEFTPLCYCWERRACLASSVRRRDSAGVTDAMQRDASMAAVVTARPLTVTDTAAFGRWWRNLPAAATVAMLRENARIFGRRWPAPI